MRDIYRQVRKPAEKLHELLVSHESIAHRSVPDMKENALSSFHNHFVKREQTFIVGEKPLDLEVHLHTDNTGMRKDPLYIFQRIIIIRVIWGKTIEILEFVQDLPVPLVHGLGKSFLVGII